VQENWEAITYRSTRRSLRSCKLPFRNGVISGFKNRDYFDRGVREKLARFVKKVTQSPFVGKLESERVVGECEVVVKLIQDLRNLSFT
jgi:hypothetical protein